MTQLTAATLFDSVEFSVVTADDFEELVALRIAAMRDSLERVGRFDPERARERLRKSFYPEHTGFVVLNGRRIGFYTFRPAADDFHLDHLYVHPDCQSRGVDSQVIRHLCKPQLINGKRAICWKYSRQIRLGSAGSGPN